MAKYSSILDQLLQHIPRNEFQQIVDKHRGDKGVRSFRCWNQETAYEFRAKAELVIGPSALRASEAGRVLSA